MDLIPNKKKFNEIKNALLDTKGAGFSLDKFLKIGIISAAALILISLAAWSGFKIYENWADKKIQDLRAEQAAVFSANDKLEADKILAVENNAAALQSLLKTHIYTSEFFDRLAKYTLPRVQWKSCSLDSRKGIVIMGGQASDYSMLAKQLLAFEAEEVGFKNIKLSNVSLDKTGGVNFSLNFEIDSKKLQKQ